MHMCIDLGKPAWLLKINRLSKLLLASYFVYWYKYSARLQLLFSSPSCRLHASISQTSTTTSLSTLVRRMQHQEKWFSSLSQQKILTFLSYIFTVQKRTGSISHREVKMETIFPARLESACLLNSSNIQLFLWNTEETKALSTHQRPINISMTQMNNVQSQLHKKQAAH